MYKIGNWFMLFFLRNNIKIPLPVHVVFIVLHGQTTGKGNPKDLFSPLSDKGISD